MSTDTVRRARAALALAGRARIRDRGAVALARGAGLRRDDVAEQAPHRALHLTGSVADVAGHRLGARLAARSLARLAEHGRVDLEVAVGTEHDVPRSSVTRTSASWPRSRRERGRGAPTAAEERLEDVAEPAEAARSPNGELSPPMS
jgi:hypothetical protein